MAGLLCHLLHRVCVSGFDYCALSPPRHLFGLRLVFPFEYLQRLHDSMIGPALVQRWVLHYPWTYEPSRPMPYPEVHLLLHWFWSPSLPLFERSEFLIATSPKKKLCVCSTNLGFSMGYVLCARYECTTLHDTRYVLRTRYV